MTDSEVNQIGQLISESKDQKLDIFLDARTNNLVFLLHLKTGEQVSASVDLTPAIDTLRKAMIERVHEST